MSKEIKYAVVSNAAQFANATEQLLSDAREKGNFILGLEVIDKTIQTKLSKNIDSLI